MHKGKIQKWGNSCAIRLPIRVLAAAGISENDEVDISADRGRVVIQLHERTQEQAFDKLLATEPEAAELMVAVKQSLAQAIATTDETINSCYSLIERLDRQQKEST